MWILAPSLLKQISFKNNLKQPLLCLRSDLLSQKDVLAGPFSAGEDKESLMLELTAMLLETAFWGTDSSHCQVSSIGGQVSSRASRQLTNISRFSTLQLDWVKNPANLQNYKNKGVNMHKFTTLQFQHTCRKCSCCWLVSLQLIMFSMILCTAARMVLL